MRFASLTRAAAALTVVWLVVEAEKAHAQTPPIQIDQNTAVAGMASDTFTWIDSLGHPRVAVLAHNDGPAGPGGAAGGTLREFRYQLPDLSTRIATVTTYGNGGYAGFGYVVSHANHSVGCIGPDDSPLGGFIFGHWYRIFEGRHHAIFRFTQNYLRYCSAMDPVEVRTIPVTIDWIFTTGHDNPVWAITYDVDLAGPDAPSGTFYDDSRAPYGELNIDGDGSTDIDGVAWGDRYKFFTTTAPVTLDSDWDWTQTNSVPYVKLWLAPPPVPGPTKDATMGIVQTQTIDQQDGGGARNTDAGAHDVRLFWGKTSAQGNAGGVYKMPWQDEWPYQANADSIGVGVSNNNARLTWRTQYGFIGPLSYNVNDQLIGQAQRTAPGYGKKSYSTYIVIGTHSSAPVEAQVAQVEDVQTLTLTAAIGSVVTSGPAGITRADNVTYQPAGYNHVYGALAFNASGNRLDANVAVGTGPLTKPLLIVGNYTAVGYPQVVRLGGAMLIADVDYFPSLRASAQELWITLNRNLNGPSNRIEIFASTTVPDPPVIGTGTPGNGSATISFTPPASDGGSSITSYRVTCNPGAFTNSDAGSPITVSGLTNGIAYDCYVVAINTVGSSGASGNVTVTPGGSTTPGGGDFDGDGKTDVLWRNFTTGDVFMHRMSGASIISGTSFYREANTQWKIITTADFNGDGKADILWRNFTTGQVYIQLMNGAAITDGAAVYVEPNMQWQILAAADFDGDGKADILWRNSSSGLVYVLLMNGLAVKGGGVVYGEPNPSWQIVAAADFDGDRKADILWRNSSTGQVYVLLMNGLAVANGGFVYTEPSQAWQIVASGDFNADGRADILWRNTSTGAVYILLMNGLSTAGGALIYTEPSQSWKINGVADFDGDGKADILWRNTVSGGEFIQLINGLSITSGTFVYNEPNTQWKIVSPTTVAAAVTGNGTN